MVHEKSNRNKEALSSYNEALVIQREAFGDLHDDIAITLGAIGSAYENLGQLDKAISHYDNVLYVRSSLHGKRHIGVGEAFSRLGGLYTKVKKHYLAKQCYSNALKILKANSISAGDSRLCQISESFNSLARLQS
jgi:tetratricopeptide (TPR) repeat protein